MKGKTVSKRESADSLPSKALSAVIAHELNNIAVPLRGFIDLAFETPVAGGIVLESLDELHLGLNRIAALGFQLESLAQQTSTILPTTLAACCTAIDQKGLETELQLEWSCAETTPIRADVENARRAIVSLAYLAGAGALRVRESVLNGQSCASCGKRFPRNKHLAEIEAQGLRPAVFQAIRAPFDALQKLRAMQRLALAALSNCTHLAGGHLIADLDRQSLSIVLPDPSR